MPAILDDPSAPLVYRTSGEEPFPTPYSALPYDVGLRKVILRDRITQATLVPLNTLLHYLTEPVTIDFFGSYWFANLYRGYS